MVPVPDTSLSVSSVAFVNMCEQKIGAGLFDEWPDRYDEWFTTPIGKLVKKYETELLLEMLAPQPGEFVLDVGCGSGVFTMDVLSCGAHIVGLDISYPMLTRAAYKTAGSVFAGVVGDMVSLPFPDDMFDKVFSMTAIEFAADAGQAVAELHRVVRKGGTVVLTSLNSKSPWAERRGQEAENGHTLFQNITFRSPDELTDLAPGESKLKTAIHFLKSEDPEKAVEIEREGALQGKDTGAFVALTWHKE
jgi:ubiquinone/menaquinone biosynthesis C-methylase UbiE